MFPAVWIKGANGMTVEEILAGESKNVEFKVQRPKDSGKYMKTVIAFSNGEGGKSSSGWMTDTHGRWNPQRERLF